MKSSMLILLAAALAVVECFKNPEYLEDSDAEVEDEEFHPRFLAVFLETEGGSWNDSDAETGTKLNFTGTAAAKAIPNIQQKSIQNVTNILGNFSAVNKFESVLEKLGYDNTSTEAGSGSTSEDTEKFRTILTALENSTLSNSTLTKVNEILNKIQSGEGFAMYKV